MLFVKKRTYGDKPRGSFASKRYWRILQERQNLEISKQWNEQCNLVKAVFKGHDGKDEERKYAETQFWIGKEYIVESARIGKFCTYIKLEGVDGEYNSVMFDVDYNDLENNFMVR